MLFSFDNRFPKIGNETYVSETAQVIGDVRIGNNCYIGHGAILRGDYGTIEIGDGTAVEEGAVIHVPTARLCKIGQKVTIGHGAIIHARSIGDLSVIGMGAVLSIESKVGEHSIIGEGAVVRMEQEIAGGTVAVGNPAEEIRKVTPKDDALWTEAKQIYIDLAKKYLAIGMHRLD